MGKKPQILVDTDILIKIFRGDKKKRKILDDNKGKLAITIITYVELLTGLKIKQRVIELNKKMRAYVVIHLSETISQKTQSIFQKYTTAHNLLPADALIASTGIVNGLPVLTDNTKDFFYKRIKIVRTKQIVIHSTIQL